MLSPATVVFDLSRKNCSSRLFYIYKQMYMSTEFIYHHTYSIKELTIPNV